jgi:hypothetical protein
VLPLTEIASGIAELLGYRKVSREEGSM